MSYASWEEVPRLPSKTHLLNRILLCRHNNPYHKCANIHSNWFWISMSFLSATLNFPVPENGEKTISEFNSWIYSPGLLFTNCVCIMYTNTNRQYEGTVKVFRNSCMYAHMTEWGWGISYILKVLWFAFWVLLGILGIQVTEGDLNVRSNIFTIPSSGNQWQESQQRQSGIYVVWALSSKRCCFVRL